MNPEKRKTAEELLKHEWILKTPSIEIDEDVIKSSLENLQYYAQHNKLQQGVVHFLTYKCAQRDEVNKLSEIFKQIDSNGDGKLTVEEIAQYIKKVMGSVDYSQIGEIFTELDIDKSGYIDYSEFLSATINKKTLLRQKELMAMFNQLDSDGSGNISKKELRKAFQTKGTK